MKIADVRPTFVVMGDDGKVALEVGRSTISTSTFGTKSRTTLEGAMNLRNALCVAGRELKWPEPADDRPQLARCDLVLHGDLREKAHDLLEALQKAGLSELVRVVEEYRSLAMPADQVKHVHFRMSEVAKILQRIRVA